MEHYVCTGTCGAVADQPGVCESEECSKQGEALSACNCEDGLHAEANSK